MYIAKAIFSGCVTFISIHFLFIALEKGHIGISLMFLAWALVCFDAFWLNVKIGKEKDV